MTRVLLAGGATGGHLYPGLAVAQYWRREEPGVGITFVGSGRGLEEKVLKGTGFSFVPMATPTLMDKKGPARWLAMTQLPAALLICLAMLVRTRVHLVLGLGGFSAGPPLLAGWMLGIPTAIMEQNAIPGMTNRWLAKLARRIFTWFSGAADFFPASKVLPLGLPVREEIRQVAGGSHSRGSSGGEQTLLILGGSQGARSVNELILKAIPKLAGLCGRVKIIHQTGPWVAEELAQAYRRFGLVARLVPFIEDMAGVYAQADLVVARAGAGTLAELAATGLPSILIPYPYAAGRHQEANAAWFVKAGAALMKPQSEWTGEGLGGSIVGLLNDPERRASMARAARNLDHPEATREVVAACRALVRV